MKTTSLRITMIVLAVVSYIGAATASEQSVLHATEKAIKNKAEQHQANAVLKDQYIVQLKTPALVSEQRKLSLQTNGKVKTVSRQSVSLKVADIASRHKALRGDFEKELLKSDNSSKVIAEYDYLLNGLAVKTSLDINKLKKLANVKAVYPVKRYSAKLDNALPLIKAFESWQKLGGQSEAGKGIKIAVIDSGINPEHPMFDDTGFVAPATKATDDYCASNEGFCNNKLIVARKYNPATLPDGEFDSPQALSGHGSHVAGIATGREVVANSGETLVGVAPGAYLMVYKALWGQDGSGDDTMLLAALNDAAKDGADIINNSWGSESGASPNNSVYKEVFEELEAEGIVLVSAAGNEGAYGAQTIGCPGCVEAGITVASTTTDFIKGYALKYGASTIVSLPGEGFVDGTSFSGSGVLASDEDALGCSAWGDTDLTGKVAVVNRGICTFADKATFAQSAGAIALVVINNEDGPLVRMQLNETVTIPTTFVSIGDGEKLVAAIEQTPSTLLSMTGLFETINDPSLADVLSSFSSKGPNGDDGFIKPDLAAPGDLILSAASPDDEASIGEDYVYLGGTSMATPMVSGAAALLKQSDPTLTAKQIKSILINSVDTGVTDTSDSRLANAFETGSGRLNIINALEIDAYAETPNLANNNCFVLCSVNGVLISRESAEVTWTSEVVMFDESIIAATSPASITLSESGASEGFTVDFELPIDAAPGWFFGQLKWTSSTGQTLVQAIAISQAREGSNRITLTKTSETASSENYELVTSNLTTQNNFDIQLDAIGGSAFDTASFVADEATELSIAANKAVLSYDVAPATFNVTNELPVNINLTEVAEASVVGCSSGCDEFTLSVDFDFQYFGESYSSITLNDNGIAVVGTDVPANTYLSGNRELPLEATINGIIAPFWADFDLKESAVTTDTGGGELYYHIHTDGESNYLIVQWNAVQLWVDADYGVDNAYWGISDSSIAFTFQLIIEQGTDNIWFNYIDIPEQPKVYTVGLESPNGTLGYTHWHNGKGVSQVSQAVQGLKPTYVPSPEVSVQFTLNKVAMDSEFAINDNVQVNEDESLTIAPLDNDLTGDRAAVVTRIGSESLLTNAFTNSDSFTLNEASLTATSEPQFGEVTKTGSSFTYTPTENFYGNDSFTYSVTNSLGETSTATVNIEVASVNDAPQILSTNVPSAITVGDTVTISAEAADVDSDLIYAWQLPDELTSDSETGEYAIGQSIEVTLSSTSKSSGSIKLIVTDREEEVSRTISVNYNQKTQPTTQTRTPKKSSSSTGIWLICMALMLVLVKRARLLTK